MKTILFLTILTQLALPQSSKLLLLMDEGFAGIYDGTELITNTIDKGMEVPAGVYTSDFSGGSNGWNQYITINTTGNIDGIWGKDDVLRLVPTSTSSNSRAAKINVGSYSKRYAVSLNYYVPSANTCGVLQAYWGNIAVLLGSSQTTNAWTSAKFNGTMSDGTNPSDDDMMLKAGATTATTDTFYVRDIKVSQIPNYLTTGNHSFDSSSTYKQAGTYSGVITATNAGNGTTNTISLASTYFTAVTSGTNYRFQVYAYTSTANTTLTFKLGDIILTNIVPTTGMNVLNFDFKATASTTGNILLYLDKAATVYIDEASLKAGR